ncbi:hypothetical protein D9756_011073 [Leucocoprinus leucothites]|uniref:Transmembrane protein n=1 Tax=Leucocoprinus leucothites TaxID=201217 RepID=A0A8H5CPS1_9AGAR|nr:hypothetical protein D9756_011073 [Leucoagaricus leucothites]
MAPDRWVVIDDADPGLDYSGTWFSDTTGSQDNVGNFGPPYLDTLHGIRADGSVSLQFNGTAVQVWGTNDVVNFDTNPDPTLQCFIDGTSIGRDTPFQFGENNWKLCGTSGLPDGSHTLQIQVKVQSSSQTFWLDQIRYIPSPTLPLDNKTILIENDDPAIQFDAQWRSLGGTANLTNEQGSVAQVTFVGTSISWYAFIPTEFAHNASQGSWSMDGGEENMFLLKGLPTDSKTTIYNQKYFTTPDFPAGPHSLAVTFHGSGQTTPLCLDYLYVKNGSFPATHSSTPDAANTGTSNSDNGGASGGTPVGAIVGGVIGGLAFLLCLAAALLFFKRRRQKNERYIDVDPQYTAPTQFSLYQNPHGAVPDTSTSYMSQTIPPLSPPPVSMTTPSSYPAHMGSNLPRKLLQEAQRGGYTLYHTSNPSHSQTVTSSDSSPWVQSSAHTDSSRTHEPIGSERLSVGQPRVEDVPPQYTQE